MQEIQRTEIARQVFFTAVPQTVLKTVGIAVNFFVPLDPSAVCANAVLPFVLARGRDFTEIKRRLDNLYGARLNSEVRKIGHSQVLTVGIETVRRRFALPGDDPVRSAARLVAELITAPPVENGRFPQADVEAEKNNVCGLIAAQENDKRTLAVNRAVSFIFDRDVYGLNKYGDVEGIKRLDGEKLYEAWQSVLKKAVVEIICVGDDAPADTAEIFAKAFAGIKRSPTVPKPIKKPK